MSLDRRTTVKLLGGAALYPFALSGTGAAANEQPYDLIIRNGIVYDGLGGQPVPADVAVRGDRIAKIGAVRDRSARIEIDARGRAVAPGFINMLSWATESLLIDGRGLSDLKQGVTTQIFGEGWSMGPLNAEMRAEMVRQQTDLKFDVSWTSLGEYLAALQSRGIAQNVASFVGAATVRIHAMGQVNRKATAAELATMQRLVREAMMDGALGVGSSLIYAPGNYADTEELIALAQAAAPFGGRYISHMRSEGDRIEAALDELIRIGREARIPVEIYHLKLAGRENWHKFDRVIAQIDAARRSGVDIAANMYTYTAGATGFDAAMPPWVQEGGYQQWAERLRNPEIRARVIDEMRKAPEGWENLYRAAGGPDNLLLIGFGNPVLKPLTGMTLTQVATLRGTSPEDTIIDLVIEDGTRVQVAYFLMSEENVRKQIQLPWMTFGSDAEAAAPEGAFLLSSTHPRTYGTFARLLGRYVRDERLITLADAVRRLTSLPAANLGLVERGRLAVGYHADITVFDPDTITDHATFASPQRYATGVSDVVVNGVHVLRDGNPTGAHGGRAVRGGGAMPAPASD
ncbi:MAG: D-aminoacylase [Sphingopyxis sp.]|nr:D-aminoacylase [Sphingopyxis sp.]